MLGETNELATVGLAKSEASLVHSMCLRMVRITT